MTHFEYLAILDDAVNATRKANKAAHAAYMADTSNGGAWSALLLSARAHQQARNAYTHAIVVESRTS